MLAIHSATIATLDGPGEGEGGVPPRKERVISAAEAAERLGVTIGAIHNAITDHQRHPGRERGLRAQRAEGYARGAWQIRVSDFNAYAARLIGHKKRGRGGGGTRDIRLIRDLPLNPEP